MIDAATRRLVRERAGNHREYCGLSQAQQQVEAECQQAEAERQQAATKRQRVETERQRAEAAEVELA